MEGRRGQFIFDPNDFKELAASFDEESYRLPKEGLLEYQEERLVNTEDLETEMAAYINEMASQLLKRGKALPAGLADQPYFGGAKKEEERRRFRP